MKDRKELLVAMLDANYAAGIACPETFAPYSDSQIAGMDRSLSVAIEELYVAPSQAESVQLDAEFEQDNAAELALRNFLATRRKCYMKNPKSVEERVTTHFSESPEMWQVKLDGNFKIWVTCEEDAEIYRLGLIQQLKGSA